MMEVVWIPVSITVATSHMWHVANATTELNLNIV